MGERGHRPHPSVAHYDWQRKQAAPGGKLDHKDVNRDVVTLSMLSLI